VAARWGWSTRVRSARAHACMGGLAACRAHVAVLPWVIIRTRPRSSTDHPAVSASRCGAPSPINQKDGDNDAVQRAKNMFEKGEDGEASNSFKAEKLVTKETEAIRCAAMLSFAMPFR